MVRRMNLRGLRFLIAILLAASFAAGGAVADAAHSAAMAGGKGMTEVVICASDGSVETITVDSHGNAVTPQKECPAIACDDCVPPQMSAVPVADFALAAELRVGDGASRLPLRPVGKHRIGSNLARAPPGEIRA